MSALVTRPNVVRPDEVYQLLIELHEGRSEEQSRKASARLILILVNHIGDEQVIREAVALAAMERQEQQ